MNKENLSNIDIREMYKDVLEQYDVIVHKEVWKLYMEREPKEGDFIGVDNNSRMIKNVVDDGTVYLINFITE